jgi:hypothetical protein
MILSVLVSLFTTLVTPVDTSIHTTVEAQAIVSDAGVTPFWMRSLQYGSVPMENPGLILRAWNGKGYNLKKKYDWKYEVEATGWTGKQNDFWLTQAYVSGRRGKWELWAGRRKEVYGLGDTTMTGGFYAWSGNAVPMPKIQLGTRDYLNFAKGWLGVHMTYSHGWFDDQSIVINSFLHQKSLYGRIGKQNSRINIFGGLNHQVIWGGEAKIKGTNLNLGSSAYNYYPSSLNAYFYVITLLKNRNFVKIDSLTSPDDSNNQYGNHLGSIDIAIKYNTDWGNLFVYKQTPYETGRVFSLVTLNDGINGISFKLNKVKIINRILIEYSYTANQGLYLSTISKILKIKDSHYPELENYFNNAGRNSWTYLNQSIGTPQIILDSQSKLGGGDYFSSNGIKSLFIKLSGEINQKTLWNFQTLISKHGTLTFGKEYLIGRKFSYLDQLSSSFSISYLYSNKLNIESIIGFDHGDKIQNSIGATLKIKIKI